MNRKIYSTKDAAMSPLVLAIVIGFIIVIIATIFPPVKQTIIDIAQAIR